MTQLTADFLSNNNNNDRNNYFATHESLVVVSRVFKHAKKNYGSDTKKIN
jgi:hypothetical protein